MATGMMAHRAGRVERPWPPAQGEWTLEDWRRLPDDDWRYEVIDGVLYMTPPPRTWHQIVLAALFARMWSHARKNRLGEVIPSPCAVQLPNQPVPVQPDILFVRAERADVIGETQIKGAPDLVVEILSPSNWLYDRREKFTLYQEAGVTEYWEAVYAALGRWEIGEEASSQTLSGFIIPLADLFTPVV